MDTLSDQPYLAQYVHRHRKSMVVYPQACSKFQRFGPIVELLHRNLSISLLFRCCDASGAFPEFQGMDGAT